LTTAIALPYIGNMDADKKIFSKWLKKKIKLEGAIKGNVLAKKIGVHPSTISGWFGEKSQGPDRELSIQICKILNVDYNDIITKERQEYQPLLQDSIVMTKDEFKKATWQKTESPQKEKYTIEIDDQETWQHFKVIKRFKNKGIALEMNERLADFEEYDQWKFLKLLNKIDEFIEEIKAQDKDQGNKVG